MVAGRTPLFRENLVKGLGTIFHSHTCQRPFKVQVSMLPHTRHPEKGVERAEREQERERSRLEYESGGSCTVMSPEAN